MKLLQFLRHGKQCIGAQVRGNSILDLTSASSKIPNNVVDFLARGENALNLAKRLTETNSESLISYDDVSVLSPVTNCEKVICVGMNYKDHCAELNIPIPTEPVIFNKFPSSIIGDKENVVIPKASSSVDWEVELAVVVGKEGKHIEESKAMEHVAGYTVALDVSARDWFGEKNSGQWLLGKTFDTFCPLGPTLVTKDEIADPHDLPLACTVDGQVMQSSNTNQLVFSIETCIAWISRVFTLKPGDVLLTGTPPGVGATRSPPVFLKDGDTVVSAIEGIGKITNPVVEE
uniref:fumarylacetoacetate hydrolase domain-containing protein 2-like n=1 Tax=Ciona intestinalis TaxID=7719 RepID=UPI000052169E|nr:fumarylacetoacetate hydrolase domain-containing protein 2-like [Ciona intestinalis]|eukprot:XP_026690422.1 fumarylacetoacetate hydrolase domain-containing protein 2-like [Ciona intestinalis]